MKKVRFKNREDQEAAERLILANGQSLADFASKAVEQQLTEDRYQVSFCVTFAKEAFEVIKEQPDVRADVRKLRQKYSLHDITVALAETMNG